MRGQPNSGASGEVIAGEVDRDAASRVAAGRSARDQSRNLARIEVVMSHQATCCP